MTVIDFKPQIEARQDAWIARRRDLHQHPELGFEEVRTAGIVAETLARLGLEVQTGIGKTGVIGILEGEGGDGPTVLVRADMDALPIVEENEVDYASQTRGTMHACGHDAHTSIGLAVAELLSAERSKLKGRIKFIFQPAEELGTGASAMIADGALENPKADVALGLHLWNERPLGQVALTDGPFMAAAGDFTIRISGKGGHGALPHLTNDPVVAASQIVVALQSIVSRNVSPTDVAVVSATYLRAGETFNVIPPTAEIRGTVRAFTRDMADLLQQRVEEIATGIAQSLGCTADVEVAYLTLPVINSADVNAHIRPALERTAPDIEIVTGYRTMLAEDVSYFLDAVPGTYFFVGSANSERGLDYPHHHPRFDFDERVIPLAVDLLASAVASYVL
jgi:amidohydrolase